MRKTTLFIDGPAVGKVLHGVERNYFTWQVDNKEIEYVVHKFLYSVKYYFVAAIDPNNLIPSKIVQMICELGIDGSNIS